jgi:hypothetical protein
VLSASNTADAISVPGAEGKNNEKKIIDASNAVVGLSSALREDKAGTADKAAFVVKTQAETIVAAPAGDAKATAKDIESINTVLQNAAASKQADSVIAVQKALGEIAVSQDPRKEAGAIAGAARAVGKAGVEAPLAAAGAEKVAAFVGATAIKLGESAAGAVAAAAADAANSDKKADAAIAAGTGNGALGKAVASAEIAVANAVLDSPSGDKREVTKTVKEAATAVSEANGNKGKETATVIDLIKIGNDAKAGSGASAEAAKDARALGEPALISVAADLKKISNPATLRAAAAVDVQVARNARLAGKNGEQVGQAAAAAAANIRKAGDVGGVVAANAAAEVIKTVSQTDLKANEIGSAKQSEKVSAAEAKVADKVLANPADAVKIAEDEKRAALIISDASSSARDATVALDIDAALAPLSTIDDAQAAVNVARAGEVLAKTIEKVTPAKGLKIATAAAASVGSVASSEKGENVRASAVGLADAAQIIDAAAQTGNTAKTQQKINEVESSLNTARKVVEAQLSSQKLGQGPLDLSPIQGPAAQYITKAAGAIKSAASAVADSAAGTEGLMASKIAATAAFVSKGTELEVNAKAKEVKAVSGKIAQAGDYSAPGAAKIALKYSKVLAKDTSRAAEIAKAEDDKAESRSSSSSSSSSASISPFSPFGYPAFGGYPAPFFHPAAAFGLPFVHPALVHPAFAFGGFNPYAAQAPFNGGVPSPFAPHPAMNPFANPFHPLNNPWTNPYHPLNFFNPYFNPYAGAAAAPADAHAADAHAADAHAADAHATDSHAADAHHH